MEYVGGPLDGGQAMICCWNVAPEHICVHVVKTHQTETVAGYRRAFRNGKMVMDFVRSISVDRYIEMRNKFA